jgi:hypothetical protein
MKLVVEDVERLTQVALPAIDVGHDQHVVGAGLSSGDRLAHRLVQIHGRAGAGDAELDPGVDEAQAGNGSPDQTALGLGAIAVELTGRALPDPDGRS